jgi:putative addiction module component (TIGR02574 family)
MTDLAKHLIEEARKLSAAEREDILEALLVSLQKEPSKDTDQAWRDLIDERLALLEGGHTETFDFDEAITELRRK